MLVPRCCTLDSGKSMSRFLLISIKSVEPLYHVSGGKPQPLIRVAASAAFWGMDKCSMDKLAKHLEINIPHGSSLLTTILSLAQGVLKDKSESEVLQICSARLAGVEPDAWAEELLQVDEAISCLDKHDEKDFKREQEQATTAKELSANLARELSARHVALRAKQAEAQGQKPAGKRAKKSSASASSSSRPTVLPQEIAQSEARLYAPPGAYIWADRRAGSWHAHLPPFRRIGRSWSTHGGEAQTLKLCLRYLWDKWCEVNGVPHSECPMQGVF